MLLTSFYLPLTLLLEAGVEVRACLVNTWDRRIDTHMLVRRLARSSGIGDISEDTLEGL